MLFVPRTDNYRGLASRRGLAFWLWRILRDLLSSPNS